MSTARFVQYKQSTIAYHVYGHGGKPVFCLHGFSLSGEAYEDLGKYCPSDKIMFALDFPLHGQTVWKEERLTADDLFQIFGLIVGQELGASLDRFILMGHSMGGRIALYMYQCFADKVDKLILMAPDGLKQLFGHRFMFKTKLGPKVFRRMSNSSKLIMSLANFARKIRLINRSVHNLIKSSYEDETTARLVFERLMVTHDFYPDTTTIKKEINQYKTPVYLFFGKYDSIVPESLGKYLREGAESYVHVQVILSGHLILANEDTLSEIASSIDD